MPRRAVSTFWIAHPNNHLISNAAAGSQVNDTVLVVFMLDCAGFRESDVCGESVIRSSGAARLIESKLTEVILVSLNPCQLGASV